MTGNAILQMPGNALFLMCVCLPVAGLAQKDNWEQVQAIEQGRKVDVRKYDGQTVSGKLEAWNANSVQIRHGSGKMVTIAKDEVSRIALVIGKTRGEKAAWAGLITAGVFGGLVGAPCGTNNGCDEGSGYVLIGMPV